MWRKKQLNGLFWNFSGLTQNLEEREKKREKMIASTKLEALLAHASQHHIEGVDIFQTLLQKAVFEGQTAPHMLLE
jgi:hypothetical protein